MAGGMFRNIGDAKANFGANYEREGHYYMLIRRVKQDQNRSEQWFVAVEKVCLGCVSAMNEPKPHRVGEQCSHLICDYGPSKDSFLPNFKAMVMGIMGVSEEDVTEEISDMVTSDDQPLAGMVVEMQNVGITTKAGKPFTRIKYVRSVPFTEVTELIDSAILEKYMTKEEMKFFLENLEKEQAEESAE